MKAEIIQYLLPNGRLRKMYVDLPDENKSKYIEMTNAGCRLEAEILTHGLVSLTVFDFKNGEDIDIEIVDNGPPVIKAYIKLLNNRLWI